MEYICSSRSGGGGQVPIPVKLKNITSTWGRKCCKLLGPPRQILNLLFGMIAFAGPNSFVFTYVFAKKAPVLEVAPQWEILNPPLLSIHYTILDESFALQKFILTKPFNFMFTKGLERAGHPVPPPLPKNIFPLKISLLPSMSKHMLFQKPIWITLLCIETTFSYFLTHNK